MSLPQGQIEGSVDVGKHEEPAAREIAGRSPTRIAFDRLRKDKIAVICALIFLFFVICAVFAPLICRVFGVELREGVPADTDVYGFPVKGPPTYGFTMDAPLGLQPNTGHDLLAEWLHGARVSLGVAVAATFISTVLGVTIGLVAGFSRGWLDRFITFVIDVFLSLPFLLVALALAPIIIVRFRNSPGQLEQVQLFSLIAVLSLFGWMTLARLIRGEVLSLREREFVLAARVIGVPTWRVLFKELLPNLVAPIVVAVSLGLPAYVAAEAALAYLGVGVFNKPSWGQTIVRAQGFFDDYPLYLYAPVVGVLVLVIALNLLGDSVRDAFDPKTRR